MPGPTIPGWGQQDHSGDWFSDPGLYSTETPEMAAQIPPGMQFSRGPNGEPGYYDPRHPINSFHPFPTQTAVATPAPAAAAGDAQSIIRQWQQTHGADSSLADLVAELKRNGINADSFMYGTTPSGNEITLNGQKYKVKTGDNANWWEPSMGEGGATQYGDFTQGFAEPFSYGDFAAPEKFSGPTFTAPTDVTEQNDPGYQARMKAGEIALQRSASAKGTLNSGGTLKDLNTFAQDYASNEYQGVYNRAYQQYATDYGTKWDEYKQNYSNKFNEWSTAYQKALGEYHDRYGIYSDSQKNAFDRNYSMAMLGLQGAQGMSQAGQGYASQYGNYLSGYGNNMSDLLTGQGNANAAGQVGSANAWNNAYGNIANLAGFYGSLYGRGNQPTSRPYNFSTANTSLW